ncbi:peptidylprolyl isomerase [Alienimonas sp. DA493]|uniref:peptidylprolyl isomerase n=1 Tax=Alienimonas sp. DA493 TaxID=3373605 RepID=UPI0037549FB6
MRISLPPRPRRLLTAALFAVCVAGLTAPMASAQGDLDAQLEAIRAREKALDEKVVELQTEYRTADEARKQEIEAEGEQLFEDFQSNVVKQRDALMSAAESAPQLSEPVAVWAATNAFGENNYAKAEQFSKKLLATAPQNRIGLNLLPASQFAQQKFAEAEQNFAKAEAAGVLLQQFASFAEAAPQYKEYWAQEQATRQKQASMNLPRVVFKTTKGDITLELFEEEAPNAVANMITLVESGFYDGTKFHRVIPNFMAQGGDPNSKNDDPSDDGRGGPGYAIDSEFDKPGARKHFRGTLSAANSGPDTAGSQFFLTHLPTPHLNGRHTVYGRVLEGQEVVDSLQIGDVIQDAEVINKRNHPYTVEKNSNG